MRSLGILLMGLALACLTACGGGGGSSGSSTTSSASGSSNNSAGGPTVVATAYSDTPNVQPVAVNQGLNGTYNLLTTSVTLCVPGTSNCKTIDNIQVDTGSVGLRVLNSALNGLPLPGVASPSGAQTGACGQFGSGITWGAVRSADVKLSGEVAAGIPIQVINDPAVPEPSDCQDRGTPMQTSGYNGILGVGLFPVDCGAACTPQEPTIPGGWYYSCPSGSSCTSSAQPLAQQITNPVAAFSTDNNGVMITLPALSSNGATSVTGTMTFGIGTQANNALGSATVLPTTGGGNHVSSTMSGVNSGKPNGFTILDTGSNGLFFNNGSLPTCGDWYCNSTTVTENVVLTAGAASAGTSLTIEGMSLLAQLLNFAFNDLAGPTSVQESDGSYMVDLGLPFFYGRNTFFAIQGRSTPGGTGPYFAF